MDELAPEPRSPRFWTIVFAIGFVQAGAQLVAQWFVENQMIKDLSVVVFGLAGLGVLAYWLHRMSIGASQHSAWSSTR